MKYLEIFFIIIWYVLLFLLVLPILFAQTNIVLTIIAILVGGVEILCIPSAVKYVKELLNET